MVNLEKWGIYLNFKPKHANISITKYSKKRALLNITPKNGKSIPLFRKAESAFKTTNQKKFKHTTMGSYSFAKNGKKKALLTYGFQIMIEKR
jgi:hypothetical protein